MQGLILAAGRGSRLGGHGAETPKCLLEVARRPLIEHQLAACADAGIAPVAIVLGYCADEVRHVVGIRAEYLQNPRWATTNSIYSFWQARDWLKGSLVVMNCDILFEPAMLSKLLATGGDALVYDSDSGRGMEHMKVKVVDGRVVDMGKEMPVEESSGENVGILYFTAETARALMNKAGEMIEKGGENYWLPAAVREIAQERPIRAVDIAGLAWGEIDSAWDLDHVRKNVWPEVARTSRRPPKVRRALSRWAALPLLALVLGTGIGVCGGREVQETTPMSWETLKMHDVPDVEIGRRNRSQTWWLLDHEGVAAVQVDGPGTIRLDSRLLLHDRSEQKQPYALRVELDGALQDLYRHDTRFDPDVKYAAGPLGKRREVIIELPTGQHTVAVRLAGADAGDRCLVRLRAPEADVDGDGS